MEGTFTLRRKNNKFKVIFDMDDVIADFVGYIIPILNIMFNKTYSLSEITNWNLKEFYGEDVNKVFERKNIFINLLPKKDVEQEFPKIYNNPQFDIWIVTACMSTEAYLEKLQWLQIFFPDFPLDRVLPCKEKDTVWADAIIDDGLHNLIAYEHIGEPVVYDMPHNRYFNDGTPVTYKRVYSMKDVREYLEEKVEGEKKIA